jgi:hypothetical protein
MENTEKKYSEILFETSGLENEPYTKNVWQMAFEMGFQYGNSMPPMSVKPAWLFKPDVEANTQLKELVCMQNRINPEIYGRLITSFFAEQMAIQKTYKDISEVNTHIRNWAKFYISNLAKQNSSNKTNKL